MSWQRLGGPSAEPPDDDDETPGPEYDGPDDDEYAADALADAAEDLWLKSRGH